MTNEDMNGRCVSEPSTGDDCLEVVFEIKRATGNEGRQLILAQSQAIQEVIEWTILQRAEPSSDGR